MFAAVFLIGEFLGGGVIVLLIQITAGIIIYFVELLLTKDAMLFEGISMIQKKIKRN